MSPDAVLEHRSSTFGRRLRRDRLRIALVIAAVEGVLVLTGIVPWWLVVALAAGTAALYWYAGREHGNADVRTVSWIAAVSQLVVVLVPVLAAVALALAIVGVVLLAVGALLVILRDRR